jgi:glutaredoxin-like protein NrdH
LKASLERRFLPGERRYNVAEQQTTEVTLYALSTCGWCKMTKAFLDENKIFYECVYVDQLEPEEKDKVMAELNELLGCRPSFPTVVCGDQHVVGFKKEQLKEILHL